MGKKTGFFYCLSQCSEMVNVTSPVLHWEQIIVGILLIYRVNFDIWRWVFCTFLAGSVRFEA